MSRRAEYYSTTTIPSSVLIWLLQFVLLFAMPISSHATIFDNGVTFLTLNQQTDGSWSSSDARALHATSEVLLTLQLLGADAVARSAAANFLETEPITDSDDRSRRIAVLAGEGLDVTALVDALLEDADANGGWGLTATFAADPLDTALSLTGLHTTGSGASAEFDDFAFLITEQNANGSWSCILHGPSDVSCTAQVLIALGAYRQQFFFESAIASGQDFLIASLNLDGSIGGVAADPVYTTALAAIALVETETDLGGTRQTLITFLQNAQGLDGSWGGDPLRTAVALRALERLLQEPPVPPVPPVCGDGEINQALEACDGADLGGFTCVTLGLEGGTLQCNASCSFDISTCTFGANPVVPPLITSEPVLNATEGQIYSYDVEATDPNSLSNALLGPSPYLSFDDSPFANLNFAYFHLEDFEDLTFDTPGVSAEAFNDDGVVATTIYKPEDFLYYPRVDSVDADDGVIDGIGRNGHSFGAPSTTPLSILFTFDATVLGALPTAAGLVWTDSYNPITFEAFDASGVSLGVNGPWDLWPGTISTGRTYEDRFFGAVHDSGISAIMITGGPSSLEVDHLQYGLVNVLTYALDAGPLGMTIDTATGLIEWLPDSSQIGDHPVTVRVVDSEGLAATQSFVVTVAPVIEAPGDEDDDGFLVDADCDDLNPNVNPGATEILGNGIDDDCNPGTPDEVAVDELTCTVTTDKIAYAAHAIMRVEATVRRSGGLGSLAGVQLALDVQHVSGTMLGEVVEALLPLAPDELIRRSFFFTTGSTAPGTVFVDTRLLSETQELSSCNTDTTIISSAEAGVGLAGTILADPPEALFGDAVVLRYTVTNHGNVTLDPTTIKLLVVDPATSSVAMTLLDTASLSIDGVLDTSQPLPSGLAPGDYLVILQAGLDPNLSTLGSATLRITGIPVSIDIKPGSYPNSINLGSGGTVPVAIFSTATFDATTVDPMTVTLESAPVKLKGKGTPQASFEDVNGDGLPDLVVHVTTDALELSETDNIANLEGKTFDGVPIFGSDTVRVVP